MSKYFEKVKRYNNAGLWSAGRVRDAVNKNWITAEEFKLITGTDYGEKVTE